jgi:hypothetical protein
MYRDPAAYHRDACEVQGLPSQFDRFEEHAAAGRHRIAWLRRALELPAETPWRLLDVGASNGALVHAAGEVGWDAEGLEPNAEICDWARRRHGLRMTVGGWEQLRGQFDLITATDVIEHLLNPGGFLSRARQHAPRLYLETPDWHASRPLDWKHVKPREHPCLYSEHALLELGGRYGWVPRAVYRPIEGKLAVLFERAG